MDAPVGTSTPVSVVGLGNMGLPIAERILEAGFPLSVHNRTEEKATPLLERGATLLASPADALRTSDVCVTVLADDAAFEDVLIAQGGVLSGARPGTTLVDMSTVSVDASERIANRGAQLGVHYLRAPVSGNPTVVRGGTLSIMVSGDEDLAEKLDPLLKAIGPTVLYIGEGEQARIVKLVLQVLVGGTAELLGEALVLGETSGVGRAKLLEAIGASAVGSKFVEYKTEPLIMDDYSATFTTSLMLKDIGLVLDLARSEGVNLPFGEQLNLLLESAVEHGYGDQDFIALFQLLREAHTHPSTQG